MAARSVSRRAAALVGRLLPGRRRRSMALRVQRAAVPHAGLVSVVVVCEPVDAPRLSAALASALGQGYPHLEVLICPVEQATGVIAPVVDRVRDRRVRVRADECTTWHEAANHGADAARGDYLLFLRGCDLLPTDAVAGSVLSLKDSGSALATARLEQAGAAEPWLERAQWAIHTPPEAAVAPDTRPGLAGDLAVGNKLIRRAAWLARGRRFGPEDDWLVSPTIAGLLASVGAVDVLDHAAYTFAADHGTRAYGATPNALPTLPEWRAQSAAVQLALAGSPLAAGWTEHLAGIELPRLLQDTERATPEQWAELRELAASLTGAEETCAAARALVALAADGRRVDVEALAADIATLGDEVPTRVSRARVLAQWRAPGLDLPPEVTQLSMAETRLRAHVQRVRGRGPNREVDLLLSIDHVDLQGVPDAVPEVLQARDPLLIQVSTPDGAALSVDLLDDAEATRWAGRRFQRGAVARVRVPGDDRAVLLLTVRLGELVRSGSVRLPAPAPRQPSRVTVTDLALVDGDLVVTATGDVDRLRLLGPDGERLDVPVSREGRGVRITLRQNRFGVPGWLGSGPHRLVTDAGNVAVGDALRERLPVELLGPWHRVRARLGPLGGLVLGLAAPLADDEAGAYQQERLRAAYATTRVPVFPDLYYFESYAGRNATDSPLAILEELRRRDPGLLARWGIRDHSEWTPDGARPVLIGSAEWYDVLARAGCLVVNTDVEEWFRRRQGQFLLQTFHGYPSKAMGQAQWAALDHGPSLVRRLRARGVDTWSAILTPTPEMTTHYREQYGFTGAALERGYPRDDDLVSPPPGRREEVRQRLGIRADQRAVLYAPTWREQLASRPRAAAMTEHLDLDVAARALGGDYVVLLRGHRFHRPSTSTPGVLDVTTYPEINDLVLASDAAVLDYSSLRFDYALTRKPMVFLVPDLEDYARGSRRFLFPFEDSAPGPWVKDTAAVVAELLDLDGLRARYAEQVARFLSDYQPWQDGRAASRVVDALLTLRTTRPTR